MAPAGTSPYACTTVSLGALTFGLRDPRFERIEAFLDIELLTIKVRLMIASVDKAREMGINWWEGDAFVSSLEGDGDKDKGELDKGKDKPELDVQKRLDALEARIAESERERA